MVTGLVQNIPQVLGRGNVCNSQEIVFRNDSYAVFKEPIILQPQKSLKIEEDFKIKTLKVCRISLDSLKKSEIRHYGRDL